MGRVGRTEALRAMALATVAWATLAAPAVAQEAGAAADHPRIVGYPTAQQLSDFYPEHAADLGVQGRARLNCIADTAGLLTQCRVTHEWPKGYGFGAAALKLSGSFRASGPGPVMTVLNFLAACRNGIVVAPKGRAEDARVFGALKCPSLSEQYAAYTGTKTVTTLLHCWLTADGLLTGCAGRQGDDQQAVDALKRLAPLFRIRPPPPMYVNGVATIVVTFTPPDPGEAADVP
jgi:hypothetical protein